ncbi:hypothetical protein PG999_013739, partial [Apiospora kogelbergensis]
LICSAVVFGLSISLARDQHQGPVPPEIGFSSFGGGFALVTCLVGMAGLWIDAIPSKVTMALDGIAAVSYLTGGIILTAALKAVKSCTAIGPDPSNDRTANNVLNFGCGEANTGPDTYQKCNDLGVQDYKDDPTIPRCMRAVTDYSFDYFGFTLCAIMVFLGYVLARRGGNRSPTVAAQV